MLTSDPDCIFCKIAAGTIPCRLVKEGTDFLAFHDINAQAPVHCLVIPKQHVPNVMHMADGDAALLGRLMQAASSIAKDEGLDKTGFRLVINTGEQGGQTVHHLHIHILGGRSLTWPPG